MGCLVGLSLKEIALSRLIITGRFYLQQRDEFQFKPKISGAKAEMVLGSRYI